MSAKSLIDDICLAIVASCEHERQEQAELWIVVEILENEAAPPLARTAAIVRHALANLGREIRRSAR